MKNATDTETDFAVETFQNPPARFRAAPFWAWNSRLKWEELEWQIDCFRRMGFGGFHMHPRTGLETPYLGTEFRALIKSCVDKAEQEGMEACLYDEDRWPSGFAGGIVTSNPAYQARYLLLTRTPYQEAQMKKCEEYWSAQAVRSENGTLLACFDVCLDKCGCLEEYRSISYNAPANGIKWYVYAETQPPDPWYNNQTYVDTLNKEAIDYFIKVTYENYYQDVGDRFGSTIPSIFTDEPQFAHKTTLCFPDEEKDVFLPWSEDFPQTYLAAYGEDLMGKLPELIWELPKGNVSVTRYRYHDHVTERFTRAFADNCGAWCKEHGLMLTGHMMEEPTLKSQTAALGEAMRAYRAFGLPGIDMLANRYEYTTVKQAVSASRQFGCGGVLSELYGVTSWSFDFRDHKLQGDWQATLGVTRRVPHLSLLSMKGEAKRDYPASIGYQVSWHSEYRQIEDHFARVNVIMTRGRALTKIGVIHPIESYWLHWGPSAQTALCRDEMDNRFQDLTRWLLFGSLDFDFISESLLPELCPKPEVSLNVGHMAYDVVVVPACETLRHTTLKFLEAFQKQGGKLLFLGNSPTLVDAIPNPAAKELYAKSTPIPFERCALLEALEPWRVIKVLDSKGEMTVNLVSQIREEDNCRWLFLAQGVEPPEKDAALSQEIRIFVEGCYSAQWWDTLTGTINPVKTTIEAGKTQVRTTLFQQDSLLLRMTPIRLDNEKAGDFPVRFVGKVSLPVKSVTDFQLSEPNVLVLDRAEFALDDSDYEPEQEIIRIDTTLRERLGFPSKRRASAQPWSLPEETIEHMVRLRFTICSEIEVDNAVLALEDVENTKIWLDGREMSPSVNGWYVDHAIQKTSLGAFNAGYHILELSVPFTRRGSLEWCFLLGDFGVHVRGTQKTVVKFPNMLGFGDLTRQELPFYGGNVTYKVPVDVPEDGCVGLHIPHYRGALITVELDNSPVGSIIFAPYDLAIPIKKGAHSLKITLFGNRVNTFGALHMAKNCRLLSPTSWRHTGDRWSEEYVWESFGILSEPVVTWSKTEK